MPTKIDYTSLEGQSLTTPVGFCIDDPRDVLKTLYQTTPIASYCGIENPLGDVSRGLTLTNPEGGDIPLGLSITSLFSDINDLIPTYLTQNRVGDDHSQVVRRTITRQLTQILRRGGVINEVDGIIDGSKLEEIFAGVQNDSPLMSLNLKKNLGLYLPPLKDIVYATFDIPIPTNGDLIRIFNDSSLN